MGLLNRNLHVILKFAKRPKTPGITLKNMAFSKQNQLFAGNFHAVLDELRADVL